MRIEPGNPNLPPAPNRKSGKVTQRVVSSSSSAEDLLESATSSEVAPLLEGLKNFPDIRRELVEEVRQRLKRGDHLTRAAAEKTAEAILADLASFIGE